MKILSPTLNLSCEATPEGIVIAIRSLAEKEDPFVILEQDELAYLQTLWTPDGYHLEIQEGGLDRHFQSTNLLSEEQVISCFNAYLLNDTTWKREIEFEQKVMRDIPFDIGRSIGQFFGGLFRGFNKT